MNLSYEANIFLPKESVAPDSYDFTSGLRPDDNFVISRNKNGETISLYGDLSWDRKPYSPNKRNSWLRFPFGELNIMDSLQTSLSKDAKWIMFMIMWYRGGMPLSHASLQKHCQCLKLLSNYCYSKNIQFIDFFHNIKEIEEFSNYSKVQSHLCSLSAIILELRKIPSKISGYNIGSPKKLTFLREKLSIKQKNIKQTAPIPTKIYSELIANINREIEDFLIVSDKLFVLVNKCLEPTNYTKNKNEFSKFLKENNLEDYFKKNNLSMNIQGLSSLLSSIQILTKLQIHIFTGMRDAEVDNLPYNCLNKGAANGVPHYLINGYTTKFNNGLRKEVHWVTSNEGFKAIEIAQKIANLIYSYLKIEDKSKDQPLFISTGYLPFNPRKLNYENLFPTDFRLSRYSFLVKKIAPVIEEQDIIELENIDIHRSWRSEEEYQIGKNWPIRTHQLRRSLALYAQRTGLVSLPSLRRQLKHITDEMSMYYSKGSSYAENLISEDKEHFGNEWQEAQPISSALSYIANVLLSEEPLAGGHASWVEHRLKNNKNTVIMESREEAIKRFKKGEMAYKETLLGGCTKIGSCDQTALNWLDTDCLTKGCRNMVCNIPQLEKVIFAQERLVNSLDEQTLEYRTEKADLNALISAKNKLIKDKT